jgi:vitamin B12 transporter
MHKYLFLIGSPLLISQPARAEEDASPIIVTATGMPLAQDRTGQPVSVIGEEEIRIVQGPDITRVLRRLPGVTVTRNGPLGGFTGVRVRGAASERLLVLVDGVRVSDVASPAGGFDFGNVMSGGLDSIELLRGSNSVVWGSDAIGGVMNLATRVEDGASASVEYGGDDQLTAQAGIGHVGEKLTAGINAGYVDARGFSSAAGGAENDGFEQFHLTARGNYALTEQLALTANASYAKGKLDIDGYPAPFYSFADTPERQDTRQWSGRVGAEYAGKALELRAGYAVADTERDLIDPSFTSAPYYATDGRSRRAELFGRVNLPANVRVDFGADKEWTRFDAGTARGKADIASTHAMIGYYGSRLTLSAGARLDDHSRFGHAWTFGANGSYAISPEWRMRASFGEGFKAPSLFQLLSEYGNATLRPETSKAYDLGIEYGHAGEGLFVALTAFRHDSKDLIDYVSCWGMSSGICTSRPFGTYDNIGKARSEGFELELRAPLGKGLNALASYSYVKSTDRSPGSFNRGNDLARRPRHAATFALDWDSPFGLALGADIRVLGRSYDNGSNTTRLGAHALADLRASFPLNDTIELFGRVENVWNEHFQTAAGYNTQGRATYLGARLKM